MEIISKEQKIPKKIHFIFLAKNESIPEIFNYCVNTAKELHPDWEIYFYNEDDALQIVQEHFPELAGLYHSYPLNVQRADILRIMIVYLHGGFYLDLDIYCLKKLDPLLKFNLVLGEEKHLKREVCTALGLKNPKRIANYMFGSAPKHPFWLDLLNEFMDRSLIEIKDENDILESTGPGLLTDFYHAKANFYKDIVLLINKDRFCLNEFHKEIACHYGNYAAHLHTGTWRWQNGQTPKFNDINKKHRLPETFESCFRYKIERNNYCNFYFNQNTTEIHSLNNSELASALKKMGNVIESLTGVIGEKVVLYGPVCKYMDGILPKNIYIYCNSSFDVTFKPEEVDFINNNFMCCIVSSPLMKEQYELNGIAVNIQIIEPGFRRYKRDLKGERDVIHFKLSCLADSFDVKTMRNLLLACKNLQNEHIPSIKIKLYDPNTKFKEMYAEFERSEIVDYIPIVVNEDYFSNWFSDLALAIFGCSNELWPGHTLEFLYMGIPIIIPDTDNYKHLLKKITANPAVIMQTFDNKGGSTNSVIITESIEKAIFNLYKEYDHYSTNTSSAAEELEDMQTIEETEQKILRIISEI